MRKTDGKKKTERVKLDKIDEREKKKTLKKATNAQTRLVKREEKNFLIVL
jgi:hypothetical protein